MLNAVAVMPLEATAFGDNNVLLVLEIVSALTRLIAENGDFILLMVHCWMSYSTIEMMQADAKIANNNTQNDIIIPRRNSLHHGSSKYMYNSSSVSPTNLEYMEKLKNFKN